MQVRRRAGVATVLAATTWGCATGGPTEAPPRPAIPAAATVAATAASSPLPLTQLATAVAREVAAMRAIAALGRDAGPPLGEANARLQRRGYSRRIPSHPAISALEAELERTAQLAGLRWLGSQTEPPAEVTVAAVSLGPTDMWQVDERALLGELQLQVDVGGTPDDIAKWVAGLPAQVERAVVFRQAERLPSGTIRLRGRAFFERTPPIPQAQATWPTLGEWLQAAGHSPHAAEGTDPAAVVLRGAVAEGRALLPDVRSVLQSVQDFPRWPARARAFARVSGEVSATNAQALVAGLRGG